VDFFGPVDVKTCNLIEIEKFKDPNHRWHKIEETHGGALLGGDPATMVERSDAASPIFHISDKTAPIMILHGDQDPLVPVSMSEDFYDRLVKAGLENQSELYIVKNGGHGTRELFQMECKEKFLPSCANMSEMEMRALFAGPRRDIDYERVPGRKQGM